MPGLDGEDWAVVEVRTVEVGEGWRMFGYWEVSPEPLTERSACLLSLFLEAAPRLGGDDVSILTDDKMLLVDLDLLRLSTLLKPSLLYYYISF